MGVLVEPATSLLFFFVCVCVCLAACICGVFVCFGFVVVFFKLDYQQKRSFESVVQSYALIFANMTITILILLMQSCVDG